MVLEGIATIIGRQLDLQLVATAASGEGAVEAFRHHKPDVTIMDLQLPGVSGLEAIRRIRGEDAQAKIIVLTMFRGDEDIYRALSAGATTYLLKDVHSSELLHTIREVYAGRTILPSNVASLLAAHDDHAPLTPREIEVIRLLARGLRNKDIAISLRITEQTAKVHVKNILAKLHVMDRSAAISTALRRGIIHLE
jgi:DNA-binding NarL/FixJ family response regulator